MNGQRLPAWDTLESALPTMAATMRRYLDQIGCVQRPATSSPRTRRCGCSPPSSPRPPRGHRGRPGWSGVHIEAYKRWLAARPERPTRVGERGHPGGPAGDAADVLRADHRMGLAGRADPSAAVRRRPAPTRPAAAQGPRRRRRREVPARRPSRSLGCWPGSWPSAAPHRNPGRRAVRPATPTRCRTGVDGLWLRIPVGKLHNDRYLPLHPALVERSPTTAAATSRPTPAVAAAQRGRRR